LDGYEQLLESEQQKKWYILNLGKLNKNYFAEKLAFIVDEREKNILLRAVKFVKTTSATITYLGVFFRKITLY